MVLKRYIIISTCSKGKVSLHLSFLSSRISSTTLLFLLVLSISLSHIIPYNLEQQAIAQIKKRTDDTDATQVDRRVHDGIESFATYKNSAFGIIIQYPFNWEKIEGDGDQDSSDKQIVKFIPQLKDHLNKYPSFTISVHNIHRNNIKDFFGLFDKPTSDTISLHGFVLSHLTPLSTNLLDFKFIKPESHETTIVGKNVAQKIVYTYKEGQEGAIAKVMEVLMIKDDRGYIFSYNADLPKYLYYLPTVQKMIDSFELIK